MTSSTREVNIPRLAYQTETRRLVAEVLLSVLVPKEERAESVVPLTFANRSPDSVHCRSQRGICDGLGCVWGCLSSVMV